MTHRYRPPALLTNDHMVESVECRSVEQTQWLRRYARQSAAAGTTKVLVVTQRDRVEVVGYYAWCMASIAVEAAPQIWADLGTMGTIGGQCEDQSVGGRLGFELSDSRWSDAGSGHV